MVVLADAGRADGSLCQITGNALSDPLAVKIQVDDFDSGALRLTSFARPSKLFTASESLISSSVGRLRVTKFDERRDAVIGILEAGRQH